MSNPYVDNINPKIIFPLEGNYGTDNTIIAPGLGDVTQYLVQLRQNYLEQASILANMPTLPQYNAQQELAIDPEKIQIRQNAEHLFSLYCDEYKQTLGFLSRSEDIAGQIHLLSLSSDDKNTSHFLEILKNKIRYGGDDLSFSPEDISKILDSLSTLKNDKAMWDILLALLPDINYYAETGAFFISFNQIDMLLQNIDIYMKMPGYTTTTPILLALLPSIDYKLEKFQAYLSIDSINRVLYTMHDRDIVDILPAILPHIRHRFEHNAYRFTLQNTLNICNGLKNVAYIGSMAGHFVINDILLELSHHMIYDNPTISTKIIGSIISSLGGISNVVYPGVESFLEQLLPYIQFQISKGQLDAASIGIILQSLDEKAVSPAVNMILEEMTMLIKSTPPFSAKHISMAINGLRTLSESEKVHELLFMLLTGEIQKENQPESLSTLYTRGLSMLYSLALYGKAGVFLMKSSAFFKSLLSRDVEFSNVLKGGLELIEKEENIIPYLAKHRNYNPLSKKAILDLHDCIYPLAKALTLYVLEDFLKKPNSQLLTFIVGQATHNTNNENNMITLVKNMIDQENSFNNDWTWYIPDDNSGQLVVSRSDGE